VSVAFEATAPIAHRVAALDWPAIATELDAYGVARTGPLLDAEEAVALRALYDTPRFRSRIDMARHGFGRGEYQYFAHPLPDVVNALRCSVYARLSPLANDWSRRLGDATDYPGTHGEYLARCHAAGQSRPTPLLLRYRAGDFNCLHQDLYGAEHFPFQLVVLLSAPGAEFDGGEFTLVEQRPRMQSRADVVTLAQGEGAIFAVRHRPVTGTRGTYRATLRHGVSRVRRGERFTLGVIFHDAG
jgi:uncharacterized protein